jgi:hypothetical protein
MSGAPQRDMVQMGIWIERVHAEQAIRLASVLGGRKSDVLRAAIGLGITELLKRHPEAARAEQADQGQVSERVA